MINFSLPKPTSWLDAYAPLAIWAIFIFILSAQQTLPGFNTGVGDFLFKKTAHILVYAVLYLLTVRAMSYNKKIDMSNQWHTPILICFFYALGDELHQSFVPFRSASVRDLGFDMLGVLIMFLKQYKYI